MTKQEIYNLLDRLAMVEEDKRDRGIIRKVK